MGAFLLYYPALGLGFLSDDFVLMRLVREGRAFDLSAREFVRPLVLIAWAPFTSLPVAAHAINVLLHGLNSALVGRVASAMGLPKATAAAASLLFLAFPAAVEPVAWCSGLQDILMTTSVLFYLIIWRHAATGVSSVTSVLALSLALAAKETAIAAPLIAAVSMWDLRRSRRRHWWVLLALGSAVSATYGVWRISSTVLPDVGSQPTVAYTLKEIAVRAFASLAAPWHSSSPLACPMTVFAAIALPAGCVVAGWRRSNSDLRLVMRLAVATLLGALPVWSMFFVAPDLAGSRYLYLPLVPWAVLLAVLGSGVFELLRSPIWIRTASLGMVVSVGVLGTRGHISHWRSAAAVRDQVLRDAARVIGTTDCPEIALLSPPDSVDGAYVFRNGLAEAVEMARPGPPAVRAVATQRCSYSWAGGAFRAPSAQAAPDAK